MIKALETAADFRRVLLLTECLHILAEEGGYQKVSTQEVRQLNAKSSACIDGVFQYTIDHFKEKVSLNAVASVACLSVPAFCNYFKRSTQKTYIDFLNEVRIGYACTLLLETTKPVLQICYESGYQTMANFHKQFLKVKRLTPLQYRKLFAPANIAKGTNIGIESW